MGGGIRQVGQDSVSSGRRLKRAEVEGGGDWTSRGMDMWEDAWSGERKPTERVKGSLDGGVRWQLSLVLSVSYIEDAW